MFTHEQVVEFVERTCREQGVPVKVTDPVVLRKVATLLRGDEPKPQKGSRQT
jgi:hypothetical protein